MSREGAKRGHDPYVKQVQVRPCDPAQAGTARVNIAGFDFELIEPVRAASADAPTQGRKEPQGHRDNPEPARDTDPPMSLQHGHGNGNGNGKIREADRALARPERHLAREEAAYDEERVPGSGEGGGFDLAGLHRLLRGRYVAAVVLSLVFAGAGVFAGIKLGGPSYQSTGVINVVSSTVIYDTPDKRNISLQDMVRAAAANIVSQRMIQLARDSDPWKKRPSPRDDETEVEFGKNLQVAQEGQLLIVKFTDREATHAQAAVDAIMDAFAKDFESQQVKRNSDALKTLEEHVRQLTDALRTNRLNISKNDRGLGPSGLQAQREYLAVELRRIDIQLGDLSIEDPVAVAAESPASNDRFLQQLEDKRFDLKSRLVQLEASGVGVNMRQYVETASMLKSVEGQIRDRKAELEAEARPAPTSGIPTTQQSPTELKKKRLMARKDELELQIADISRSISDIEAYLIDEARTQHDLDTAEEVLKQRRLEQKVYQASMTGADLPLTPYRNTKIAFSVGGGLGGIGLGFGLMALLGLMDRRVLEPGDTKAVGPHYPVLGVLPQLPDDLANPEQTATAAQAVHEVRNRLQLTVGGRMQQVFAVTGSVAGCGKTSLTLGLGVSFAAGGFRTLVVDADLVGGGLSSRVTTLARRKIGQLLLKEGLVTPGQLDEALSRGRAAGRRVGEMLVQLGYVAEADLLAAVERQSKYPIGILDAIGGEELSECTVATGIDNLWAITLGGATPGDAGVISGAALRRFIERARQRFEIIILDSGPVPGSIEASLAAAHADAVVLVVSRGDTRPYVERSIKYLRELPVAFAGLVFNRARKRDIDRYGSSRVSGDGSVSQQRMVPVDLPENLRFGPVPRCVVSRSVRPGEQFGSN